MLFSLSALLHVLAASATIPFVVAQTPTPVTTDDLDSKISPNAAPPGFNVDGESVFTNFVNAYNNKQYFTRLTRTDVREKPGSDPTPAFRFHWCSDLTFSNNLGNNSSLMGMAGRCVERLMPGNADLITSGSQTPYVTLDGWGATVGVSTVFVEQQNVFSGQMHTNTDDGTWRMWDDGRKTMTMIAWEPNDEGICTPTLP